MISDDIILCADINKGSLYLFFILLTLAVTEKVLLLFKSYLEKLHYYRCNTVTVSLMASTSESVEEGEQKSNLHF